MKSLELKSITTLGDLGYRQLKNMERLEADIYRPDKMFHMGNGWPGDWEGRTLLGLVRLWEATNREPSYLKEIIQALPEHLNEKGYLGHILAEGQADEQQTSGHNWLLRGLLEYQRLTGDDQIRGLAQRIIENLYLPLRGAYRRYPAHPEQRIMDGRPDGFLTGKCQNGWYTSTDIGCAYMSLDGLSLAYLMMPSPALRELLEEMVEQFQTIDFIRLSMQTHATLSALRGILRFYAAVGNESYLDFAKGLFELYQQHGMTANYANYNWFDRPEWTEPCAIIDSYMVAMELFRLTEEIAYFELAQNIYFNGICAAQRSNGGFGCDICVGVNSSMIRTLDYGTENGVATDAYWCCSMRGGEGLAEVSRSIAMQKDGVLYFGFYTPSRIRADGQEIVISTRYPHEGHVELEISGQGGSGQEIALFVPSFSTRWTVSVDGCTQETAREGGFVRVRVAGGEHCTVTLDFDIPVYFDEWRGAPALQGYGAIKHGFRMMGITTTNEKQVDISALTVGKDGDLHLVDEILKPLSQTYTIPMDMLSQYQSQILFRRK